jgi:hypothetical protein
MPPKYLLSLLQSACADHIRNTRRDEGGGVKSTDSAKLLVKTFFAAEIRAVGSLRLEKRAADSHSRFRVKRISRQPLDTAIAPILVSMGAKSSHGRGDSGFSAESFSCRERQVYRNCEAGRV